MSAYSQNNFIKERLELFDFILKGGFDLKTGKLWIIEPFQLRFRLGESIKDLKIPYLFGGEDESIIEKAIVALIVLLKRRFEPYVETGIKDSLSSLLDIETALIEKTYRTDYFLPDSVEKNIASEILTTTPVIDSGILKTWLGSNGYGKAYYVLCKAILRKAVLEELHLEGMERTSFLAVMAIVNATRKKKEDIIRNAKVRSLNYERLDQIIGLALYFVLKTAAKTVASELKQIMSSYESADTESLFEGCFTPRSFLTIYGNIINSDLNPYGLQKDIVASLKPVYEGAVADAATTEDIAARIEDEIRKNKSLMEELTLLSNINYMRQLIADYLLDYDISGMDVHPFLAELYCDNRLIQNLFADSTAAVKLMEGLEKVKGQFPKDTSRTEKINALLEFIASLKKTSLSSLLGIGKKREATIGGIINGLIAYRFDEEVEKFVSSMRELMINRRSEFSSETLKMEYERGRLYRFSTDERHILKELAIEAEGHLFVDMNDFTRKTLRAKEITMADFMESNFYKPILSAASRYGSSTSGLANNKQSIKLNNLLGDAAVFSGGVTNLIALAGDIQQIMRRYKEQLKKRVPHIVEEELLQNVHRNFEAVKEDIARELAETERAAVASGKKELKEKVLELKEKEQRLEKTYGEELEAAIGQEMEAGLFIAYGSKAEIIAMRDSFWGEVTVAIGEKINEAARGTSRSSIVRAKMERLLEEERMKRHNPNLAYPLDVYIDTTYGILMPTSLDDLMEAIIIQKNISKARDIAQILAQESYKDLRSIISGEPFSSLRILTTTSDIYNKGQALSEDALNAYIKENRGKGFFFKRKAQITELDKEIQKTFFFPFKILELWFGVFVTEGMKNIEIFCKAGEITFKGFEAATPTVVYEIVNKNSEFSRFLLKHHFDTWYEDAKRASR